MEINEVLANAARQDMNRQRQVEAAKAVTNRLLEARESETPDKDLIRDLCEERRVLEEEKMGLQARIVAAQEIINEAVDGGNASEYVNRISDALAE